jgi:N-acyl-L-homoserine lactone synthetase
VSGHASRWNRTTAVAPGLGPYQVQFAAGTAPRTAEYRLRYAAFVEEHPWLPPHPSGLERDQFDACACAATLVDESTGETVACQRLILPERLPVPIMTNVERFHRALLDDQTGRQRWPATLPRASWAEVSRLTIAPRFRWGGGARPAVPALTAISYATMALAIAFARPVLFSLSEPRAEVLLRRAGIRLQQIGAPVDFHGARAVFRIDVGATRAAVPAHLRHAVDDLVDAARDVARTAFHY